MQLQVEHLSKHFGGLKAVNDVSFTVEQNSITGLIGPNGSGKTTTLNMISGFLSATEGSVSFEDEVITGKSMAQINRSGIARTFQQIRLFPELTCFQNVLVGRHNIEKEPWYVSLFGNNQHSHATKMARQRSLEILDFVGLYELRQQKARNLSYGNQRKLEIARALATQPKLLLLDEPVAGMNPTESESVVGLLRELKKTGLTIILVEHSMNVVMNVTEYIVVLDQGAIIATGAPEDILSNEKVIEAYLGKRGGKR